MTLTRFPDLGIERSEIESLAQSLVRIPSYTTEETPLATHIYEYMRSIGLDAQLEAVPLGNGATSHNVVGKIQGAGTGPTLLLTGHMDHAPAQGRDYDDLSRWQRDPFAGVIEGDWLYGKGSQDEKGGLCAMLIAAKALLESGVQPPGDVYFAPVQGHKRVSSGTRSLIASGRRFDVAINTENSGNAIVPRWVGRAEAKISVKARAGGRELHFHFKEVDPELRDQRSVFEQTGRLLAALGPEMAAPDSSSWLTFSQHDGLPGYPQYRIEKLITRSQMVVDVELQVRTVPGQSEQSLRDDLNGLIGRLQAEDAHFEAELVFPLAQIRPAAHLPDDDPLVAALSQAYVQVTGHSPDVGASGRLGAAADASVFIENGIKTVIFGPGGGMSDIEYQRAVHQGTVPPDERISIAQIATAAEVYAHAALMSLGS